MRMPNSILLAQILPFEASQDAQGFTYIVPQDLRAIIQIGQLVQMPLRGDVAHGIVASLDSVAHEVVTDELKTITQIIENTPLFQPEQIHTMLSYAQKHAIHIHKVAAFFMPASIRNRITKYGLKAQNPVASSWELRSQATTPELVFFPNSKNVLLEAWELLKHPGVAIITPSDIFTQKALSYFWEIPPTLGVFDTSMTETARAKFWIDIFWDKYHSVIWTRRLVTYNLKRFHTVVFLEDTLFRELLHSFHRYHALEILSGSLHAGQEFRIYSSTPSIESMSLALAKKINFTTRL